MTKREDLESVVGVSRQADELRAKLRAQEAEIDALKELWSTVLPASWMPGQGQFGVWIRRYGLLWSRRASRSLAANSTK